MRRRVSRSQLCEAVTGRCDPAGAWGCLPPCRGWGARRMVIEVAAAEPDSWHGAAVLHESRGGDQHDQSHPRVPFQIGSNHRRSIAMRIKLTHVAPLLAAGAAAVAISAAPTAAAAPTSAHKTCTHSVSGSQCESAGNIEINNTPTTQFTPHYPEWAGNLRFHHGRHT